MPYGRESPAIEKVNASNFCNVMRRRGVRRISFYGDSMTRTMVHSLWSLLGFKEFGSLCPGEIEAGCSRTVQCGGANSSVEVHQVREGDTGTVRSNMTNLAREIARADIMVLNFGAHYVPLAYENESFTAPFREYVEDMGALAAIVSNELQAQGSRKQIVFRSSPQGHPLCDRLKGFIPSTAATMAASVRAWEKCEDCRGRHGWTLFPAYDRIARDMLEPVGVHFLDVSTLSNQRPDAHTAVRHGKGRLPPDCLHFSLPGVPDTWNALLLSALERCE